MRVHAKSIVIRMTVMVRVGRQHGTITIHDTELKSYAQGTAIYESWAKLRDG
jgi:hypothetical protein